MSANDYRHLKKGGALHSSDQRGSMVAGFLSKLGLPNPQPFASFALFSQLPPTTHAWYGYGSVTGVVSLASILPYVVVASSDDIQDAAYNQRNDWVHEVTGTAADRQQQLGQIMRATQRHYAEVRLGRSFVLSDFVEFDLKGDWELQLETL